MFTQAVNEASTLGWGSRMKGFIACFVVGGVCTILVRTCDTFSILWRILACAQQGREPRRPYWFFLPRGMLATRSRPAVKCQLLFRDGEESRLFVCVCVCLSQGVCMLFLPRIGLTLFIVFYTLGNICALARSVSTQQQELNRDRQKMGNSAIFLSPSLM